MKFMISWKIPPGSHKPAAEGFLRSGAPPPPGLKMIGRWHAPGSGVTLRVRTPKVESNKLSWLEEFPISDWSL
jgi:hypothetical protein